MKQDGIRRLLVHQHAKDAGLPIPMTEWAFARAEMGRQWRLDFAWPQQRLGMEVDGGAWTQGRHTRGKGFIEDMAKSNAAVLLGWRVLRYTPQQIDTGEWIEGVKRALALNIARWYLRSQHHD